MVQRLKKQPKGSTARSGLKVRGGSLAL